MNKLPLFPTLGKVLKKSFVEFYQSFGFSLLLGLIWMPGYLALIFVASPILYGIAKQMPSFAVLGMLGLTVVNALLTGPVTTAMYGFYQQRKDGYPSFRSFFATLKQGYWRSAGLHAIYWLVISLLFFNISLATVPKANFLFKIASLFSVYCVFFLSLLPFFFHPLLHLNHGIKKTIRKSCILLLDNFGVCFWLNLVLGLLLLASTLFPFLLFGYGGLLIYVIDSGFETIWNKYGD